MRALNAALLAVAVAFLATCSPPESVIQPVSAPVRQAYVTHAHTQLTAWEIDLAKLELKLPRSCNAQACTQGVRVASAQEDLRLARSRVEELRVSPLGAWDPLKTVVEEALCNVSAQVAALKENPKPSHPRLESASSVPIVCLPSTTADPV